MGEVSLKLIVPGVASQNSPRSRFVYLLLEFPVSTESVCPLFHGLLIINWIVLCWNMGILPKQRT
jgi:hypothetical protein